eukprot:CAMPEP_0113608090 /NCGR_PEP_ID=MMETSP0017_2-20120614/3733_1 /TAXON_ID=2856 /ORGANISM="Cylindrotheca closterium" /LENGTH=299 /DNA_ID=CAMNT_0000516739 /DNA_START=1778 /DNA_END=2674 /DNA_ORIENTATION=- /assembly_acc=CAM_ASM_000147
MPESEMEPPHLLLLVSKSSIGNREQLANQELTLTMLESQEGLTPQVLDGADPANRERRNELFGISGLRAKYPQLFAVKSRDEPPAFIGNFETIQELNECGQLTKAYLLGVSESTEKESAADGDDTSPLESTSRSRGLPPEDDSTTTQTSIIVNAQLLLLISNLSGNRQQDSNQSQLHQLLQSKGFSRLSIQTLDGADPANRERRDELFGISGLRAKYPQLFLVVETPKVSFLPLSWMGTKSRTMFLGDYDTIQAMEKDGSLTEASLFVEMEKQNDKNGNKWLMLGANIALVAAIVVGIA